MEQRMRVLVRRSGTLCILTLLCFIPPPAHAQSTEAALRCERLIFPVALSPGQPADLSVVAWLCARGSIHNKTIQVLVHGAVYDHNVWDFPFQPETYSYVRAATAAGY